MSTVTEIVVSARTTTSMRFGTKPSRVTRSVRGPAGSTSCARPLASVLTVMLSERMRMPSTIPIDSRTVTLTVPESDC
jgi:hypothetical protein